MERELISKAPHFQNGRNVIHWLFLSKKKRKKKKNSKAVLRLLKESYVCITACCM